MATNKLKLTLSALSIFIICSAVQCNKLVCDPDPVYSFELGVTARPDNETVKIGDTIWLEINEPDRLLDFRSNQMVTFSGVENLGSVLGYQKLLNDGFSEKALKKFQFILHKGKLLNNQLDLELFNEYLFENINGYYQFRLGFIPRDTGIFSVVFSNAANVYRKSDKCTKASFAINFHNTNQHYTLNPNFMGGPTPVGGDYYIRVVN